MLPQAQKKANKENADGGVSPSADGDQRSARWMGGRFFEKSDVKTFKAAAALNSPLNTNSLFFKPMNKSCDVRRAYVAAHDLVSVYQHVGIHCSLVVLIVSHLDGISGQLLFLEL